MSIDFRPRTGQLYGLSSGSALYTLNTQSGVASKVGAGFTDALNGGNFGFDFNPVIDRIRIVSDADQNLVAHPDTGAANIAVTTPVFYGPGDPNNGAQPNVVHHAYDGNVLGGLSAATQLRAIDTNLNILVTQANNAGTLGTIGPLGINAEDIGGFDVATREELSPHFPTGWQRNFHVVFDQSLDGSGNFARRNSANRLGACRGTSARTGRTCASRPRRVCYAIVFEIVA